MPGPGKRFQKGNPGKKKGTKSKKVLAWEQLGDFITEEGAKRVQEILRTSTPKDFISYYSTLLEYFKPKIARTELTGKDGEDLTINTKITFK